MPDAIGEHRNRRRAAAVLARRKQSSHRRAYFEHIEVIRRNEAADHPIRPIASGQVDALRHQRSEPGEGLRLGPPVIQIGLGDEITPGGCGRVNHRQLIRMRIGQRFQQNRADHAEHRRIGPDPEA